MPSPAPIAQASTDVPSERADCRRGELVARIEAVLFAAGEPVGLRKLAQWASAEKVSDVEIGLQQLADFLENDGSSFRLVEIAGGYQLLTKPELRPWLEPLCRLKLGATLSNPMLETLAVVAYRQPITRAEVEAVRGVQVGEILHHLLELDLVRLAGRDTSLGRPFLYATTPKFLQTFGLRTLSELPMVEILSRPEPTKTQAGPEA